MREVPVAADVVLADVLAAPVTPALVVVATPLAAYAAAGGALVGLLAPGAVRVPGGLVVPAGLVAGLRPGTELLVGDGLLRVGGARLVPRRWWDSTVRAVGPVLPPAAGGGLPDAVSDAAHALGDALADGGDVAAAVAGLVGLGPGLTPAGDDVLAGALVALVAGGDDDRAAALRAGVRPCRERTTTLSAALLGHAAAGRAVPQLARHLRAPDDAVALAALLAVGGSSGAALALGARIGLSCLARSSLSEGAARMSPARDREVA